MDVNPTFGHQELLETLSQTGSNKSGGAATTESHDSRSRKQYTQRGSSSSSSKHSRQSCSGGLAPPRQGGAGIGSLGTASQHVDEAYRRLGQRLSSQAHGDGSSVASSVTKLPRVTGLTPSDASGFQIYGTRRREQQQVQGNMQQQRQQHQQNSSRADQEEGLATRRPPSSIEHESPQRMDSKDYRNSKVAKTRYSDHGEHHPRTTPNILRKLTTEARETFLLWQQTFEKQEFDERQQQERQLRLQQQHGRSTDSETELSPQRYAFSQLALEGTTPGDHHRGSEDLTAAFNQRLGRIMTGGGAASRPANKGLLSSVLEGHSESNTTASGPAATGDRSHYSSPSLSISTKDSRNPASLGGGSVSVGGTAASRASTTRGICLTSPSEPVANEGLDNVEGNLIVFENDCIKVPRKSVHTIGAANERWKHRSAVFRIQGLLGQGTFAQVFKSFHSESGQTVAIKIVKNKPAYTRQASVEIDIFRALKENATSLPSEGSMVELLCYFVYQSHLCLVFESLGQNLYEILKRRQFRGLPLTLVQRIVQQAVTSIRELAQRNIVHCDLKPENVLMVSDRVADDLVAAGDGRRRTAPLQTSSRCETTLSGDSRGETSSGSSATVPAYNRPAVIHETGVEEVRKGEIKLIDFGSACFEGFTAHTYIQSRFYRSPEVLIGVPYDTVVDMWSLGCVAAELFLGLPILPGVHEHDQLGRIHEMISKIPDWMLDQGSKATKFYIKYVRRPPGSSSPGQFDSISGGSSAPTLPQWRLKTQNEYISSLSQGEIRKKGGISKLEKQPGNRYFKRKILADILFLHGQSTVGLDKELVPAFVHFLYGLLDPDPWKRWTAFQAMQHPFVTGDLRKLRPKRSETKLNPVEENQANLSLDFYWEPPWDPAICRRKLLNVQKLREKQQTMRKAFSGRQSQGATVLESGTERYRAQYGNSTSPPAMNQVLPPVQVTVSPPFQVSSSTGSNMTSPSRQSMDSRRFSGAKDFGGQFAPSSLANPRQPMHQGQVIGDPFSVKYGSLAPPNLSSLSGAQSFSGMDHAPGQYPKEGDFGLALQRPGVVPGTGLDSMSHSQEGWSAGQGSFTGQTSTTFPSTAASVSQYQFGGQFQNIQGIHDGFSKPTTPEFSLPGQYQHTFGVGPNGAPVSLDSHSGAYRNQYANTPQMSSVSSSVTMPESSMIDPQQQIAQLQQQQTAFLQQHYAQNSSVQQQFGGQLGFAALQQQQVFLAAAPGGGQYYVTISATGQPIVLQPVGYMDPNASLSNQQQLLLQPGLAQQQQLPSGLAMPFVSQQMFQQQQQQQEFQPLQQQQQQQQHPMMFPPETTNNSGYSGWNNHPQTQGAQPHHSHRRSSHGSRRPRYDRGGTSM